jgi:activator of HSP90 ATPase
MCKTIKQKVKFKATPAEIYAVLADAKTQSRVTGRKAQISEKVGGEFNVSDGFASGINVDLVPGKRVVQAWRGREFAEGIFSMAAFVLTALPRGGGTQVVLTHRGVPKEWIPSVETFWRERYWSKIREHLGTRSSS